MKILIACEFSGIVRDAFIAKGHDAMSCDLLPTEKDGPHYQGDIFDIIDDGWDMMIAHPSCTRLCNSGVRWLKERNLWEEMKTSAKFFKKLLDCNIKKKAIENPIMHKYALEIIGRKYDQLIQPWMFGHGESKATCLWLENLPPLIPTQIVNGRAGKIHRMPPSINRWKDRSRTLAGIGQAMALQWG